MFCILNCILNVSFSILETLVTLDYNSRSVVPKQTLDDTFNAYS